MESKVWSTKCKMVPLGTRPQNLLLQAETSSVKGNHWSLVRRWCIRQELKGNELELKLKDNSYSNSQENDYARNEKSSEVCGGLLARVVETHILH